ncbi:MAG: stage V sporulation protein E [Patescibacteria group bacterium]|nr:MAG: stage V sporulation protein E [Patescibacteria group bacterium]
MKNHRFVVFLTAVLLTIIGVVFVFESSTAESFVTFGNQYHYLIQHIIGLAFAVVAFFIGLFMSPKIWVKVSPILYCIGILLLILVFIPGIGLSLNGARRWISIAGIGFQSIEFFKFAMIAFYAHWLSKHQRFGPFLFLTAIPAVLVILQPDLGSLLVVTAIACALYFVAGGKIKNLLILAAIGLPLLVIAIVSSPYRLNRVTTFLNPESDPLGASFHIRQITLALGRGGLTGQGIGESQQKFSYIPEASTDSIFAIIAEEIGFIGSLLIFALYSVFLFAAFKLVSDSEQPTTIQLLGIGIILWIGLQIILNLSAVVGLVPLTGVPLPFISYGRSSLVMVLFATGILIRIGKKA